METTEQFILTAEPGLAWCKWISPCTNMCIIHGYMNMYAFVCGCVEFVMRIRNHSVWIPLIETLFLINNLCYSHFFQLLLILHSNSLYIHFLRMLVIFFTNHFWLDMISIIKKNHIKLRLVLIHQLILISATFI